MWRNGFQEWHPQPFIWAVGYGTQGYEGDFRLHITSQSGGCLLGRCRESYTVSISDQEWEPGDGWQPAKSFTNEVNAKAATTTGATRLNNDHERLQTLCPRERHRVEQRSARDCQPPPVWLWRRKHVSYLPTTVEEPAETCKHASPGKVTSDKYHCYKPNDGIHRIYLSVFQTWAVNMSKVSSENWWRAWHMKLCEAVAYFPPSPCF